MLEACPDCTDYMMAHGKGGWYVRRWLFNLIPWGKEWVVCETCEGTGLVNEDE